MTMENGKGQTMNTDEHWTRNQIAYAQALADAWSALHVLCVVTAPADVQALDISAPARRAWHSRVALGELTDVIIRQPWHQSQGMYDRAGETFQDVVDAIDGMVDFPRVSADEIGTLRGIDAALYRARTTVLTARALADRCNYDDDTPLTNVLLAVHWVADTTAELVGKPATPWSDNGENDERY